MRPLQRQRAWVDDAIGEAKEHGMNSILGKIANLSHEDAQGVIYHLVQHYLDRDTIIGRDLDVLAEAFTQSDIDEAEWRLRDE